MTNTKRLGVALIASTLALSLSACGGPMNHSLYSTAQPVVERTHYTFDVVGGPGGPSIPEQRRLAGWFEALNLKYGDRVSIETDGTDPATVSAVGKIVDRYGLALSEHAPITEGFVEPGRTPTGRTITMATTRTPPAATTAAQPTAILLRWSPIRKTSSVDRRSKATP